VQVTLGQHLLALALVVVDVLARGLRIRQLLAVPVGRAVFINTSGDALAAVTPARMGGEPIRFLGFRRAGASAGAVLAAFATEVGIDIVVLAGVAAGLSAWVAHGGAVWRETWEHTRLTPGLLSLGLAPVAGATLLAGGRRARRTRAKLRAALRDARDALKARSWVTLSAVAGLTLTSVAARSAILPVLAARVPGANLPAVVAGSFVLVFGQGVLPIPGGLGAVDLGFAFGFAPLLGGASLARLLLLWRFYSLALGAIAGAVLLAWSAWQLTRSPERRPALAASPPSQALDPSD
jgi:hypothetical protein